MPVPKGKYIGQKHWRWTGISQAWGKRVAFINGLIVRCSLCGSETHLVVHHIDGNPRNNRLENLLVMCRSCHRTIHSRKYRKRIEVQCANCAKVLYRRPSDLKGKINMFCSRQCHNLWRRTGQYFTCELCGKRFYRKPSKIFPHHFCSILCRNRWLNWR